MADRLFISHASEDEAAVNRIVAYLEANGALCWLASRDIPAKSIYADEIAEAMQSCSACAVILSAASNQSKAVKRELELASHYDKPFIPIRIDATEPARGFDYYLRNAQWIDYRRDGERALIRIASGMRGDASLSAPTTAAKPAQPRRSVVVLTLATLALAIGGLAWLALGHRESWQAATATFLADATSATTAPSPPTLTSLVGSSWWGTTTNPCCPNFGFRLDDDGTASWGTTQGAYPNGGGTFRWTLDGSTLIISQEAFMRLSNMPGQGDVYTGTVEGDTFTGRWSSGGASDGDFAFTLHRLAR